MKEMIAYCGLGCEKCDAYLATLHDDEDLREKTAKLWSELNGVTILPEHINCQGCRANGAKTMFCENLCEIRKCAAGKRSKPAEPARRWLPVRPSERLSQTTTRRGRT